MRDAGAGGQEGGGGGGSASAGALGGRGGEVTLVSGHGGLEAPVEGLGFGVTRLHLPGAVLPRHPLPPPKQRALP